MLRKLVRARIDGSSQSLDLMVQPIEDSYVRRSQRLGSVQQRRGYFIVFAGLSINRVCLRVDRVLSVETLLASRAGLKMGLVVFVGMLLASGVDLRVVLVGRDFALEVLRLFR